MHSLPIAGEHPLATDPKADRKLQAINALLRCPTFTEAAAAAGVARNTLWRWLQEPAFQKALNGARRDLQFQTLDAVQAANSSAMNLLLAIMRDPSASPSHCLRASEALVQLGRGARQGDLQRRLSRVEQAVGAREALLRPVPSTI